MKEDVKMKNWVLFLFQYATVVFFIFLAEILLAVAVLMKQQTVRANERSTRKTDLFSLQYEETFKTSLNSVMQSYPNQPMASHVDRLQNAVRLSLYLISSIISIRLSTIVILLWN